MAAVVEGYGDVQAIPVLLSKVGQKIGRPIVADNPIRAGEWARLSKAGELERRLDLAASRNCDVILVALDLDDGCAADEARNANRRVSDWKNGRAINVQVVFFVREYEVMFLNYPDCAVGLDQGVPVPNASQIRGAKERMRDIIGRRYKETQDQIEFTRRLDLVPLYDRDRSFRRLCRALTGMNYPDLSGIFS